MPTTPDRRRRARATRRTRIYGLSPEDHRTLYVAQAGRCAICRRATGRSKALAVDHDHAEEARTGDVRASVRGLLCATCNRMLGHARDDPAFLIRAARYLIAPPAPRTIGTGRPRTS